MKLLIASDIHGSEYYLSKLVERYRIEAPDRILLLGDLLYHGPRNDLPKGYAPKKVIDILNSLKDEILCVRGNCDAEVDQMVLDFPIMSDCTVLMHGRTDIFATHGHIYNVDNLPKLKDGDILLHGHTHVPAWDRVELCDGGSVMYINPGSVSIPKAGSEHGYIMFEDGTFLWKNLDGETYNRLII